MGRVSKSRLNRRSNGVKGWLKRSKVKEVSELNLASIDSSKLEKANEVLRNNIQQKESKLKNKKTYSKMMHTSKRSIKDKREKDMAIKELNRFKSLEESKEPDEDVSEVMEFEGINIVAPASNICEKKTRKRPAPASSTREFESLSRSGKKKRLSRELMKKLLKRSKNMLQIN